MTLLAALAGFTLLAQSVSSSVTAPSSIKVDVRLVSTSFTVRDRSGKLIPALTKDDFEIFDDGVQQSIAHFSRAEDLPLTLGLIVDVSGSQERFVKQHHRDIERFLKAVMKPRDQAFLVCFGNHLRLGSDLTNEPSQIVAGLDGFNKNKIPPGLPELGPKERRSEGTAFYDAIFYGVSEKLAGAEGARRALIVFSDGEDNSSANDMMTAIEAAQRYDTVIYSMRYTEISHGGMTGRNKYGIKVMERIARETGGADFDAGEKGMTDFFRTIEEDLRTSYQIGYYPTTPTGDGTFHKIKVKPADQTYTVRVKTGYYTR